MTATKQQRLFPFESVLIRRLRLLSLASLYEVDPVKRLEYQVLQAEYTALHAKLWRITGSAALPSTPVQGAE